MQKEQAQPHHQEEGEEDGDQRHAPPAGAVAAGAGLSRGHDSQDTLLRPQKPIPGRKIRKAPLAPTLFESSFLSIRGYGLMIALGVPVAMLVVAWHARRRGHGAIARHLPEAFFLSAGAAYLGGKLGFILGYPDDFRSLLAGGGWAAVATQGFVFYGALILQVPAAVVYFRWLKVPFAAGLDSMIPGIPVMHAFGRAGCFLAGCCYGCRHDGPLAVTFREGIGLNGVPLHPVQLYEVAGNLAILAAILLSSRRSPAPGTLSLVYFGLYAVLRFITERFRGDGNPTFTGQLSGHVPGDPPPGVTLAQGIGIAVVLVLLPVVYRLFLRNRSRGS